MAGAVAVIPFDYEKRPNVLRLSAAGRIFLMKTKDETEMGRWIEAFEMSTGISSDLGDREMPEFSLYPAPRARGMIITWFFH